MTDTQFVVTPDPDSDASAHSEEEGQQLTEVQAQVDASTRTEISDLRARVFGTDHALSGISMRLQQLDLLSSKLVDAPEKIVTDARRMLEGAMSQTVVTLEHKLQAFQEKVEVAYSVSQECNKRILSYDTNLQLAFTRIQDLSTRHDVDLSTIYAQLQRLNSSTMQCMSDLQVLSAELRGSIYDVRMSEALSGNIKLLVNSDDETVSAAILNAAVEGAFTRSFDVSLVSEKDDGLEGSLYATHLWANLAPTVSVANTGCWDPTVQDVRDAELEDPLIRSGLLQLLVIFATDEGDTKIYEVDDTVEVKVKIEATAGRPWTAAEVVKTYTVVA